MRKINIKRCVPDGTNTDVIIKYLTRYFFGFVKKGLFHLQHCKLVVSLLTLSGIYRRKSKTINFSTYHLSEMRHCELLWMGKGLLWNVSSSLQLWVSRGFNSIPIIDCWKFNKEVRARTDLNYSRSCYEYLIEFTLGDKQQLFPNRRTDATPAWSGVPPLLFSSYTERIQRSS